MIVLIMWYNHGMTIKLSDAFKLSWNNIGEHKKRSLIIILTISLLFGVIMGFNFITSGIEETTIKASAGQTGGDVYIKARYGSWARNDDFDFISTPDEIAQISLEPVLDEEDDKKIRERAEEYGGEVVGYYWYYQLDYPYQVIDKSVVDVFIDNSLWNKVPEDKIPAIMPEGWKPPQNMENLEERLGNTLYRVGSIPSTEIGEPTLAGFNPLNIILAQLPSATNDDFWLVDDGSGKVEQYIQEQLEKYLSEDGGWYNTTPIQKTAVVKFADPYQATAFASPDEEKFGIKVYTDFEYNAQDLLGTTLMVIDSFNTQKVLLITVEILLLIVATIIAVMTFAHLIDQDAATVALYRAMGASTGNIYLIYLLYLIELCLLAIVATIMIAFIFIALLALTSTGALAERLQEFYSLDYLPEITLFMFNGAFWFILFVIMMVAPLSLLFTMRRFSAKHIAKKLKED